MKSVKRHLSLICVVALVLAIMVPTVFAATTGYNYTYDFNLGSGGSKTYNGKTENALWYPGDGSGTWSIYVMGIQIQVCRLQNCTISDRLIPMLQLKQCRALTEVRAIANPLLGLMGRHIMQSSLRKQTRVFTERQICRSKQ